MMKKLSNAAFIYTILALVAGVIYREYTKMLGFTGETNLSLLHTHLFTLGMIFFLIVLALEVTLNLSKQKYFNVFFIFYNVGLSLTAIMMAIRGFLQINGGQLSKALDASVAGISGIGHILLGVGLVLFFINLKRAINKKDVLS
ncbi:MAG: DUF2871 domain-containing protein [Turicibacter sp.]|nr:DUF2871 domain-containing protein [Turicibacter sp.]MDO5793061.1 DUF2871 domain-containing protein [Turicibacter sp.]